MKPLKSLHGCHWRLARQCAKAGRFLFCLTAIGLILGSTLTAQADRKSREEEKAQQQRLERQLRDVEYILKHESDGTLSDRKAALKDLISTGVAPDEAYWQAGYIKRGDEWVSVGDRWLTPEQEQQLEEYTKARFNYASDDEGHYKLAQWCAENGFSAQAYGHLMAVLVNNPDHEGLRQMLGYERIGHRWMNEEEFLVAIREADRLVRELQEWGPVVSEIHDGLHSRVKQNQTIARNQLKEITDVAAIPALELILLPSSDIAAAACVEQLCEIEHRRSSIALCKAAMFLPVSAGETKQAAVDELKTRPLDDFVPVLLAKMQTPMTLKYSLLRQVFSEFSHGPFNLPNKYLQIRNVNWAQVELSTEFGHEVRELTLIYVISDHTNHMMPNSNMPLGSAMFQLRGKSIVTQKRKPFATNEFQGNENRESLMRELAENLYQVEKTAQRQNEQIYDLNEEIGELLRLVTHRSNDRSPDDWWRWWNQRIELEENQKTRRNIANVAEVFERIDRITQLEPMVGLKSCFTAGTPVWTDRGPRPIEQLKVGDMALTQDVETGELMYRPIIRTTTRKPKPLVTIDLGAEQITSTGGHPFFVAGEGWVRARELKAGQMLHTPTGSIRIDSVTETPEDETFNLVIDGYHTYFVGMSQVLVHDVSITSPTDAIVPGLLDR